ncbi:VOC family protein [soil metagenome]
MTKRIVPYLWFEKDAVEAANFYVSLFKDGEVLGITKYENGGPDGDSSFQIIDLRLRNIEYAIMEAGPEFKFNESVSFLIECEDQAEIDHFWDGFLNNGGEASYCGWLKDKYGFSWQVVPTRLDEMLKDPDRAAADRVMKALLSMVKLDIATFEAAFKGE